MRKEVPMRAMPLEFRSQAKANPSFEESWIIQSGPQTAYCDIPIEFGGRGDGFSPEDLFLQAAINCFVGTFKAIAKASRVNYGELQVNGKLIVDKNIEGKIVMKTVYLDIEVYNAERMDRVESIVTKALKDGFILNSLKSEIQHSLSFKN